MVLLFAVLFLSSDSTCRLIYVLMEWDSQRNNLVFRNGQVSGKVSKFMVCDRDNSSENRRADIGVLPCFDKVIAVWKLQLKKPFYAYVGITRNATCVGRTLARACNLNSGSLITTEEQHEVY